MNEKHSIESLFYFSFVGETVTYIMMRKAILNACKWLRSTLDNIRFLLKSIFKDKSRLETFG